VHAWSCAGCVKCMLLRQEPLLWILQGLEQSMSRRVQCSGSTAPCLLSIALASAFLGCATVPAGFCTLLPPPAIAQAMPEKADTPSNFTLKLRKHIR